MIATPGAQGAIGTRVQAAIEASQRHLLSLQHPDGYWWAHLDSNVTITAEVLLLHKIWGTETALPLHKIETYLRREQRDHGGWELFYGDGGELSVTIEAYMALRLLRVPLDDPALVRARAFIIARGGISRSRIFTKLHLALIGCYDWRGLPTLPSWIMLLPPRGLFSIYDMSSWARGSTVPLVIAFDRRPVFNVEPSINLDELYAEGREHARFELPAADRVLDKIFLAIDRVLRFMQDANAVPLRKRGVEAALAWVLERQEPTGDWAGIIPPMLNSLLALRSLGFAPDELHVARGFAALKNFYVEDDQTFWVQPSISVIWDTALAARALADSGLPHNHEALQRAGEWLLSKQIFARGDWCVRSRGEPGGWAFEFVNDFYPDVDDTSAVVMALHEIELTDSARKRQAMRRGAAWIDSMQCSSGGWAAYDVDNTKDWLNRLPYGDLRAMIDPPTADLTAHVLEMHALCGTSGDPVALEQARRALLAEQECDGSWFGRWGVNYLNGTSAAMVALSRLPCDDACAQALDRGAAWLLRVQHADHGWGETARTYDDPAQKGLGPSTASQTAWALLGLLAVYDRLAGYARDAVDRGIGFLLDRQRNGTWDEPDFTGTGFPGHFYLNYNLYRDHYPLSALGRYRTIVCARSG
ncbi:MAG TPA: squalene--hopene cyclase [Candidatus Acidoferrales bacterium]|nr:squalene--hopene cyclase [Candidatus Acidoferrales bacterium]